MWNIYIYAALFAWVGSQQIPKSCHSCGMIWPSIWCLRAQLSADVRPHTHSQVFDTNIASSELLLVTMTKHKSHIYKAACDWRGGEKYEIKIGKSLKNLAFSVVTVHFSTWFKKQKDLWYDLKLPAKHWLSFTTVNMGRKKSWNSAFSYHCYRGLLLLRTDYASPFDFVITRFYCIWFWQFYCITEN